jgi:hypothetical protein
MGKRQNAFYSDFDSAQSLFTDCVSMPEINRSGTLLYSCLVYPQAYVKIVFVDKEI